MISKPVISTLTEVSVKNYHKGIIVIVSVQKLQFGIKKFLLTNIVIMPTPVTLCTNLPIVYRERVTLMGMGLFNIYVPIIFFAKH